MDNVSKMRASLKAGLKPKDTLIPTKETVSVTPKDERAVDQRKLPDEKITNLYPIRLQIPIDQQQNLILTKVTGLRRGATINKGSVVRALINLLEKVQFSDADRVASEQELEVFLREKLKGI
jgi:hypothetical protein